MQLQHQSSNGLQQEFERTTHELDDLDRLLSNSGNFSDFVSTPVDVSLPNPDDTVPGLRQHGHGTEGLQPHALPVTPQHSRKQRALDKSREAQKRFRQRQRARLETIQAQLDDTTKQLRDLQLQQQQLQTRNILLEKVAQLSKEQTADDYLAWQNKQAELDFSCAHTEPTAHGFTLTLTIFGHKESKACRTVSKMSLTELAALWTEYMRKLGKCLLSLQQDRSGAARPLLDLWVAEAIALICCIRVYNPEFLKAIDSTAMNGSAAARPSHPLLVHHLELLQLTDAQLQDGLYLRRIAAARAAALGRQRHAATQQLLSQSSSKQHPSDHLADSKAISERLRLIGLAEYKLHGIVTDALFNGIFTSIQNALGLVHMYPFLPDPLEYLELIAERQGQKDAPTANAASEGDWQVLLAYCAKVTAADCCEHVPLCSSVPSALGPAMNGASAAAPDVATSPHSNGGAAVAPGRAGAQGPSTGQGPIHFSPESAARQAVFQSSQSQPLSPHGQQPVSSIQSPAYAQPAAWDEYAQVMQIPIARQPSRQGSIGRAAAPEQAMLRQASNPAPNSMTSQAMLRQESMPGQNGALDPGQYQLPFSQAAQNAPVGTTPPSLVPLHTPLNQEASQTGHQAGMLSQHPNQASTHPHISTPPAQPHLPLRTPQQNLNRPPAHVPQSMAQQHTGHPYAMQPGQQPALKQAFTSTVGATQRAGSLPSWIEQNLASAFTASSSQAGTTTLRQQGSTAVPQNRAMSPQALYPTAAMRSQQLSNQAVPTAPSKSTVQAPLAPFLNEQLKRMLAQSNPSARRGF